MMQLVVFYCKQRDFMTIWVMRHTIKYSAVVQHNIITDAVVDTVENSVS